MFLCKDETKAYPPSDIRLLSVRTDSGRKTSLRSWPHFNWLTIYHPTPPPAKKTPQKYRYYSVTEPDGTHVSLIEKRKTLQSVRHR